MKQWCKLQTATLNDHRLTKLPCEAQLTYYKLLHVAAICDAGGALIENDGTPIDYDTIAHYLRKDAAACRADVLALKKSGLLTIGTNSEIIVSGYSSEKDSTATERKRKQRERDKKSDTPDDVTDDVTDDILFDVTDDVTEMSHRDTKKMSRSDVTVTEKEKEKEEEEEKDRDKKKFVTEEKFPAAAEDEIIKLWIEWANAKNVAPTFRQRILEAVKDIDVWRDTLTFGAKNRKIEHTNTSLDWALSNYKSGITQKRAQALSVNKTNGSTGGRYADKIVPVEVNGTKVYYG